MDGSAAHFANKHFTTAKPHMICIFCEWKSSYRAFWNSWAMSTVAVLEMCCEAAEHARTH